MGQAELHFVSELDEAQRSSWIELWRTSEFASWGQHPSWGELARSLGARVTYAIGSEGGRMKLAGIFALSRGPLNLPIREAVCLRGPIVTDVQVAQRWLPRIRDHFRNASVGSVRIGPYWRLPDAEAMETALFEEGFPPCEAHSALGRRSTGLLELRQSDEVLLQSFKKGTRAEVRQAQKAGITTRVLQGADDSREFFSSLKHRDVQRGVTVSSAHEFAASADLVARCPELGAIIGAYHESRFLGGLLVLRGGPTAFMNKFVVGEQSKRLFPTIRLAPIVFAAGMTWARMQGCRSADLEGYSPTEAATADLAFINRYKAGFNPVPTEVLGQYRAVCDPRIDLARRFAERIAWGARLPRRLAYRLEFGRKKRSVEQATH